MSKHRFVALDGLRGAAALAVVIFHSVVVTDVAPIAHGYMAVDFFFALSGFVIAFAYEERLRANWNLADFLLSRRDRLFPMILLGVALGLGVHLWFGLLPRWAAVITSVLEVFSIPAPPQLVDGNLWPINSPIWSLFWELVANLVFVLIGFRLSSRVLGAIVIAAAAALLIAAVKYHTLDWGHAWDHLWVGPARVAFSFTVGQLIARAWRHGKLPRLALPAWVLSVVLTVSLLVPRTFHVPVVDVALVFIWFPLIIVVGASRPPAGRLWDYIGRLSYPLYLIHFPIFQAIHAIKGSFPTTTAGRIAMGAGSIALTVVAAMIALHLYDEPVRHWLAGRRSQRRIAIQP